MSAFAFEDRVQVRRWGLSIMLALVLHGAIGVALLNWGKAIVSMNPSSPLVINVDLAPLVVASSPATTAVAPAPNPPLAERIIPDAQGSAAGGWDRSGAKSPASAGASGEPIAPSIAPAAVAPSVAGSSIDRGEETNAEGKAIGGGGTSRAEPNSGNGNAAVDTSPLRSNGMTTMPLDTSITVMPSLYGKKEGGGMARQKEHTVIFRPSKHALHSNEPQHEHNLNAANGVLTRTNAVGAHMQDRVRAAFAKAGGRAEIRFSVGGTAVPGGAAGANAADRVTKNAIGMTVPIHPSVPTANTGEPKTAAVSPNAASATMNRAAMNGHDMIRPGVRTGSIGGPAKSSTGVLSGNDFHVRRP